MKKKLSLLLAAAMVVSALAGCGPRNTGSASSGSASSSGASSSVDTSSDASSSGNNSGEQAETVSVMVMSGPTGVGAAQMMTTHALDSSPKVFYDFTVAAENSEVTNALINGDADIAAVATNMAANLVNKTDGGIQVLAINTLGVLYILEKGDSVHSMADLRGKTVYATGQGANPEYILNYLLTQNDVDPASVDIQWMTAQEVTAKMLTEEAAICMLPVPAATAVMMQDPAVRQAVSLSEVWDNLDQGALAQGCIVARTEFIEENPKAIENFLTAYERSLAYMNDEANRSDAAAMVALHGITANDKIAAKAIPQCNLTFVTGEEMKDMLEQFYQVLFQADPASIGGAMPYDSFYYGVE